MKQKAKTFMHDIWTTFRQPELRILPGHLAFFFVLSIIPLIAIIGGIASIFSVSVDSIKDLIMSSFPNEVANLLMPIVSGKGINGGMVVFFVSAFLLASNGTHSMILASNMLYKVDNEDFIKRRIKAILMTFILVSLLVFVLLVPAFGDLIFKLIRSVFHNENVVGTIFTIYQIVKYPLSLLLIFFNIKLLYTLAPDTNIESESTTYGALFTTVGWILATEVYSIYVEVFAKYDIFYGSISNILILMLWVYLLAYILVFGMALNVTNRKKKGTIKEKIRAI